MSALSLTKQALSVALSNLVDAKDRAAVEPLVNSINRNAQDAKLDDQDCQRFNNVWQTIRDFRQGTLRPAKLAERCDRWESDPVFGAVARSLRAAAAARLPSSTAASVSVPTMPEEVVTVHIDSKSVTPQPARIDLSNMAVDANPGKQQVITRTGDDFSYTSESPIDALWRQAAGGGLFYVNAQGAEVSCPTTLNKDNAGDKKAAQPAILAFEKLLQDNKLISAASGYVVEDVLLTSCSQVTTGVTPALVANLHLKLGQGRVGGAPDELNTPNKSKLILTRDGVRMEMGPDENANPHSQSWRVEFQVPYIKAAALKDAKDGTEISATAEFTPVNTEIFCQSHVRDIRSDAAAAIKTAGTKESLTRRSTRQKRAITQLQALHQRVKKLIASAPHHVSRDVQIELLRLVGDTARAIEDSLKTRSRNKRADTESVWRATDGALTRLSPEESKAPADPVRPLKAMLGPKGVGLTKALNPSSFERNHSILVGEARKHQHLGKLADCKDLPVEGTSEAQLLELLANDYLAIPVDQRNTYVFARRAAPLFRKERDQGTDTEDRARALLSKLLPPIQTTRDQVTLDSARRALDAKVKSAVGDAKNDVQIEHDVERSDYEIGGVDMPRQVRDKAAREARVKAAIRTECEKAVRASVPAIADVDTAVNTLFQAVFRVATQEFGNATDGAVDSLARDRARSYKLTVVDRLDKLFVKAVGNQVRVGFESVGRLTLVTMAGTTDVVARLNPDRSRREVASEAVIGLTPAGGIQAACDKLEVSRLELVAKFEEAAVVAGHADDEEGVIAI